MDARTIALIGGILAGTVYCTGRPSEQPAAPAEVECVPTRGSAAVVPPLDIENHTHLTEFWKHVLFETSQDERVFYDIRDFKFYTTVFADQHSDKEKIDEWVKNNLHTSFKNCLREILHEGRTPSDDLGKLVQDKATEIEVDSAKTSSVTDMDNIILETEEFFADIQDNIRGRNGHKEDQRAGFHLYKLYHEDMRRILVDHGVPEDIIYLTFGESSFNPTAKSSAGAEGIWQIIRPTAKQYGLKVNRRIDEREDILRSTEGAALFLKHLYERFGKWDLAILAYNQGEGNLSRAIRESGSNDITDLITFNDYSFRFVVGKHYIPIFLAAHQGVSSWETDEQEVPNEKRYFLTLDRDESLREVFKESDLDNLDLILIEGTQVHIAIDIDEKNRFLAAYHAKDLPIRTHTVRRGENLERIAAKYHSTVDEIKHLNGRSAEDLLSGRRLRVRRRRAEYKDELSAYIQSMDDMQQGLAQAYAHIPVDRQISSDTSNPPSLTDQLIKDSPYRFDGNATVREFDQLNQDSTINPDPENFIVDMYNSRGITITTPRGSNIKIEGDGTYRPPRDRQFGSASELDSRIERVFGRKLTISFEESSCSYTLGPDTRIVLKKISSVK